MLGKIFPSLRQKNTASSATLALVFCTLTTGSLFATDPINLASGNNNIALPRIDSEGLTTAMAWVETSPEGREQIKTLQVKDSQVDPALLSSLIETIPHVSTGMICELTVTMPSGISAPSISWIEDTEDESILYYWDHWLEKPQQVTKTPQIIEFPVTEVDETGQVLIAWSQVSGGQSQLMTATRSVDKHWSALELSQDERPYDVLPQLFPLKKGAELYWFSLEDGSINARMSTLGGDDPFTISEGNLGALGAARLPILYRVGEQNELGAIWLEQNDSSETHKVLDPRALTDQPVALGEEGTIEAPSVSHDQYAAFIWFENSEEGKALKVVHPRTTANRPVSRSAKDPVISATANLLHSLWIDENESGDPQLLYWPIK